MKYDDWLHQWLNLYVKSAVKTTTYQKYDGIVKNHIAPALGQYEIEDIKANILQSFTLGLTEKGMSAGTVNIVLSLIKSSLHRATAIGVAEKEYSSSIVRPRVREKRVECFSKTEQRAIETYIADTGKERLFGIVLCLYTGLRIGELLALTWSDIDLQTGVIFVSKTCHDSWENHRYVKVIDTPKTACSQRTIPIPRKLIARLRHWQRSARGVYVVCGRGEHGIGVRSYQRTFENLLKRLHIPHKGFHALRHTFATRALECGMDVKTLAEVMGHRNPTVTLMRYAHSLIEHKAEMMNRLGELLL
ncbi:MAG: tyrosine-type recombinase/integrase [Eubacteriales bacterium]